MPPAHGAGNLTIYTDDTTHHTRHHSAGPPPRRATPVTRGSPTPSGPGVRAGAHRAGRARPRVVGDHRPRSRSLADLGPRAPDGRDAPTLARGAERPRVADPVRALPNLAARRN